MYTLHIISKVDETSRKFQRRYVHFAKRFRGRIVLHWRDASFFHGTLRPGLNRQETDRPGTCRLAIPSISLGA
jgi:hypothetical protein